MDLQDSTECRVNNVGGMAISAGWGKGRPDQLEVAAPKGRIRAVVSKGDLAIHPKLEPAHNNGAVYVDMYHQR